MIDKKNLLIDQYSCEIICGRGIAHCEIHIFINHHEYAQRYLAMGIIELHHYY
jgi:hypothetical protein